MNIINTGSSGRRDNVGVKLITEGLAEREIGCVIFASQIELSGRA